MPYQIKDWDKYYENDRSRQRDKCSFVCIPNKQDGMGLTHILCEKDGTAILGVFLLIVEACSRHPRPRQGWLTDDGDQMGRPWLLSEMAIRWRRTEKEIERALQVLTETRVGWLSPPTNHQVTADSPPDNQEGKGKEEKGMEGKGIEGNVDPSHLSLAIYLKEKILETKQQRIEESTLDKWADVVRLMETRDGRSIKEIRAMIDECHNNPVSRTGFTWKNNVLSMGALRERWNEGKIWIGMNKKEETDGEKRLRYLQEKIGQS
jgi:hypothetical protein